MMSNNFKITLSIKPKHGIIYSYMRENNLTIKQLSKIIGVGSAWLGGVINFKIIPVKLDGESTQKLLSYFGLQYSDLFPSESLKIISGEHQVSKEIPKDRLIQWTGEQFDELPTIEYREDNLLDQKIEEILNTLNPREKEIIKLRFGLNGSNKKTYDSIAKSFGVTRVRIRQIEQKAIRKLRHPSRSNILKSCVT